MRQTQDTADNDSWPLCSEGSILASTEESVYQYAWPLPLNSEVLEDDPMRIGCSSFSRSSGSTECLESEQAFRLFEGEVEQLNDVIVEDEPFDPSREKFVAERGSRTSIHQGSGGSCCWVLILVRMSNFIDDWTPLTLVSLYFVISTSIYMVLPENVVTVVWYVYLTLAFLVSAAVTAEACASNRPARDARRARKRLAETGEEYFWTKDLLGINRVRPISDFGSSAADAKPGDCRIPAERKRHRYEASPICDTRNRLSYR